MQIQETGVYIFTEQKKQRELDRDGSTETHRAFTQHAPRHLSKLYLHAFYFGRKFTLEYSLL